MSFFATRKATLPIPGEAEQTVSVRQLTGRELEQAQAAQVQNVRNGFTARGPSAAFERLIMGKFSESDLTSIQADPLRDVDRLSVVRFGLEACSLLPSLAIADGVDPILNLSDEGLEFCATEIMRLTKPERFLTGEEQKAAQKNG